MEIHLTQEELDVLEEMGIDVETHIKKLIVSHQNYELNKVFVAKSLSEKKDILEKK